ncbi:transglutaminase-like domain-containing protein [Winogradskya humida]|uniref:Transglutaminase n=1 Tax=Winogradskya humida TaxID=113566 RepID=A0ABQ3ZPU5_9ACTN|nr:transglutaminase-like domain-containing protein [Actinoplanes humidus]GIE20601.1 transglutaminase [Actinoplanes humidus]
MDTSQVGCTLGFDVSEPAEIVLQIAAQKPRNESLTVSTDGGRVPTTEIGGRQHIVHAPKGILTVTYSAEMPAEQPRPEDVTDLERIVALRPSRYCPSDRLGGFAAKQFNQDNTADTVRAIAAWVHDHLDYVVGSSGPSTDASDTLMDGRGVCRDYAHLMATLCRAKDIPARVAAVYAPGLSPMDFHLVVEAAVQGRWTVWDSTRLAPRQSLIRIATGRDAADTAFATTISGYLLLPELMITAVAGGSLPYDNHTDLVELP